MMNVNSNLNFANAVRIVNLPLPAAGGEAATKAYVDSLVENLSWKDEVNVASTENVNIATNGHIIDGVGLTEGRRVLLKNQTNGAENGIYVANSSGALARSADADTAAKLARAVVGVTSGNTNAGATYRLITNGTITLDTTVLTWDVFGGSVPVATAANVTTGTANNVFVTPLAMYTTVPRMVTETVGNGSATSFPITHNLNTLAVICEVYDATTGAKVIADLAATSVNVVTVSFATAPATNSKRVVIFGVPV